MPDLDLLFPDKSINILPLVINPSIRAKRSKTCHIYYYSILCDAVAQVQTKNLTNFKVQTNPQTKRSDSSLNI